MMTNKKKPNCFMIPPEYIYTNKFHKAVHDGRGTPEIYDEENGYLWFLMISQMCVCYGRPYSIKLGKPISIEVIKSYCQSLYGVCEHEHKHVHKHEYKYKNLFRCYVYLEGLEYLPLNLLDDSYFLVLSNKYHRHGTFMSLGKTYSLISSRESVTGS